MNAVKSTVIYRVSTQLITVNIFFNSCLIQLILCIRPKNTVINMTTVENHSNNPTPVDNYSKHYATIGNQND